MITTGNRNASHQTHNVQPNPRATGLKMSMRFKRNIQDARGFTLLEVMVAITILLLVILPLSSLYVRSLTVIQNAALYSQAIQLGQERMEICEVLEYPALYYYNEILTPGFPYRGTLPPSHEYDRDGGQMVSVGGNAYDNRPNPDPDGPEWWYFDPTDSDGDHYPVPVYRDYFNNYTGILLDPNFNGLCDDDLDGDGDAGILGGPDMEDIEIATNGSLRMYSDPEFNNTPAQAELGATYVPGDGLFDTVIEGLYVSSMDPMYRMVRITESSSPILDFALLLDRQHTEFLLGGTVTDFRHREKTFSTHIRMTTILDPTPALGNPNNEETWLDNLYFYEKENTDNYTPAELAKLRWCLMRDYPLVPGLTNWDVGIADAGIEETDEYSFNYSPPMYGKRIIVTVFYLTGEAEIQLLDIDGDGVVEEVPIETYGGARRIRLERNFYSPEAFSSSGKIYMPPPRWLVSGEGNDDNPVRGTLIPDVDDGGDDSDPCSLENLGLPYLD